MKSLFERTSSNWVRYSEYEWIRQQFNDLVFTYMTSVIYYEDYDTMTPEHRMLLQQGKDKKD